MYDFKPQETGELELHRGDIITVLNRSDKNWWKGRIGQRKGIFPATYVVPYNRWRANSFQYFVGTVLAAPWKNFRDWTELNCNSTALYGFFLKVFFYMGLFQVLFTRVFFFFYTVLLSHACLMHIFVTGCLWMLARKDFENLVNSFFFLFQLTRRKKLNLLSSSNLK